MVIVSYLTEGVFIGLLSEFKKNSLIRKAHELNSKGEYQKAIECYDEILRTDLYYTNAWYGKSVVLRELGKYQDALEANEKALELDPEYVGALTNKGALLEILGKIMTH